MHSSSWVPSEENVLQHKRKLNRIFRGRWVVVHVGRILHLWECNTSIVNVSAERVHEKKLIIYIVLFTTFSQMELRLCISKCYSLFLPTPIRIYIFHPFSNIKLCWDGWLSGWMRYFLLVLQFVLSHLEQRDFLHLATSCLSKKGNGVSFRK